MSKRISRYFVVVTLFVVLVGLSGSFYECKAEKPALPLFSLDNKTATTEKVSKPDIFVRSAFAPEYTVDSDIVNTTYVGEMYVTGYDICMSCCGKTDGITASGQAAVVGITCAHPSLPFGTVLYIDGIGTRIVQDRGGRLDVLCNNHSECYAITGLMMFGLY